MGLLSQALQASRRAHAPRRGPALDFERDDTLVETRGATDEIIRSGARRHRARRAIRARERVWEFR